jgi:hypothetical protein
VKEKRFPGSARQGKSKKRTKSSAEARQIGKDESPSAIRAIRGKQIKESYMHAYDRQCQQDQSKGDIYAYT